MALREEIQRRIDKKRKEINDLESKVRAAIIYIQALEDTLRIIPEEPAMDEVTSSPTSVIVKLEEVLRSGSKPDRARDVLRAAGQPMHIVKMLEAMGEKTDLESRAALAGSLGAYVRDGKIFTRPAPNTFGLVEFPALRPSPTIVVEPPPGFGEDGGEGITEEDVPF